MIKKTKDCFKQIAEKIEKAFEYNRHNKKSPIRLTQIEISRGLYNIGTDKMLTKIKEELKSDDYFKIKLQDNDYYCVLFIKYDNKVI